MNAPMPAEAAVGERERKLRVELAACYRLIHHFGLSDLSYTHISVRIPARPDRFLINPFGLFFDEITASSLVEVNSQGDVVYDLTGRGINRAGYVIHSAIHEARKDVECVIHTHTVAGMAVAAQEEGLLPITQHAMRFAGRTGYHEYEGISLSEDERPRLARDLGDAQILVLRNHGMLAVGSSIGEAFLLIYFLERACQAQVLATARQVRLPDARAIAHTARVFDDGAEYIARDWAALLRLADRIAPGYAL